MQGEPGRAKHTTDEAKEWLQHARYWIHHIHEYLAVICTQRSCLSALRFSRLCFSDEVTVQNAPNNPDGWISVDLKKSHLQLPELPLYLHLRPEFTSTTTTPQLSPNNFNMCHTVIAQRMCKTCRCSLGETVTDFTRCARKCSSPFYCLTPEPQMELCSPCTAAATISAPVLAYDVEDAYTTAAT
ncbi:Uncharacterized protein HZ326_21770, partial [Fusarium oxysporum f. sp. albedinis]